MCHWSWSNMLTKRWRVHLVTTKSQVCRLWRWFSNPVDITRNNQTPEIQRLENASENGRFHGPCSEPPGQQVFFIIQQFSWYYSPLHICPLPLNSTIAQLPLSILIIYALHSCKNCWVLPWDSAIFPRIFWHIRGFNFTKKTLKNHVHLIRTVFSVSFLPEHDVTSYAYTTLEHFHMEFWFGTCSCDTWAQCWGQRLDVQAAHFGARVLKRWACWGGLKLGFIRRWQLLKLPETFTGKSRPPSPGPSFPGRFTPGALHVARCDTWAQCWVEVQCQGCPECSKGGHLERRACWRGLKNGFLKFSWGNLAPQAHLFLRDSLHGSVKFHKESKQVALWRATKTHLHRQWGHLDLQTSVRSGLKDSLLVCVIWSANLFWGQDCPMKISANFVNFYPLKKPIFKPLQHARFSRWPPSEHSFIKMGSLFCKSSLKITLTTKSLQPTIDLGDIGGLRTTVRRVPPPPSPWSHRLLIHSRSRVRWMDPQETTSREILQPNDSKCNVRYGHDLWPLKDSRVSEVQENKANEEDCCT